MAGLAPQVDPEDIIAKIQDLDLAESGSQHIHTHGGTHHVTPYSTRYCSSLSIPKFKIPQQGVHGDTVYRLLKDELDLDGRPNLNLASFVSTYMDERAERLMLENLNKNLADADEYPSVMQMHSRCVSILADLWGSFTTETPIGTATTGSSEAIHLAGLAMKRRWQELRRAAGKSTDSPNIIMGANAQVALEKFARYFEVEARILPVSEKSCYRLDPALIRANIDENTIGVFVILGSTYTGHYEPVQEISEVLDAYEKETGVDIPIHVDAASGGFVAPFTHAQAGPNKNWNFALPRVKSINTSGHKFGLVYAGLGWIIWRDAAYLPKHLIFELHYLGGTEESYTLNFSRPGAQVIAQYFNLIHLGFDGYRQIMENCMANARLLSKSLEATGWYTCCSDIHRPVGVHSADDTTTTTTTKKDFDNHNTKTSADYNPGLPVVAFRLSDKFKKAYPHIRQESISTLLRARQYIIPNYALPPSCNSTEILRVVVRESMAFDLVDRLITDICAVTQLLMTADPTDLAAFSGGRDTSMEGTHARVGTRKHEGKARRPMSEGVHRSVC
ncbi:pyridoxal phosphate-dependent transferase [Phlyctochytrium arcticum]|nr:pyridoxal phosphate-dependent transferase [Phlyctochytrium arcticum]